jgi:hypothetical protein
MSIESCISRCRGAGSVCDLERLSGSSRRSSGLSLCPLI